MQQVVIQFNFPNVSLQQYDKIWDDMKAAGHSHPKGLISHVGAPTGDGGLFVVDVWQSQEAFEEFGNILMPLLAKNDFPEVQPKVFPVHFVLVQAQEEMVS
jgi:hypothetical protein